MTDGTGVVVNFDNEMGECAGSQKQPAERKELSSGDEQKPYYFLLHVLPPISLPKFRPWNKKIYTAKSHMFSVGIDDALIDIGMRFL